MLYYVQKYLSENRMEALKNPIMWVILAVELIGMVVLGIAGYGQYFWIYGIFVVLTVIAIAVYQSRKNKAGTL
jgi:Flp pilus assembly protein TadB